ncbi:MAG: hypothetical protein WKG00_32225 [Polyangiaceae bacterium]
MSRVSTDRAHRVFLVAALAAIAGGCGGDEPCEVVCARNVECQSDAPSKDECLALCEDLSGDEGYADALEEQADCYEDASCAEIEGGTCTPDYS